jgi:hypothetical protein
MYIGTFSKPPFIVWRIAFGSCNPGTVNYGTIV